MVWLERCCFDGQVTAKKLSDVVLGKIMSKKTCTIVHTHFFNILLLGDTKGTSRRSERVARISGQKNNASNNISQHAIVYLYFYLDDVL